PWLPLRVSSGWQSPPPALFPYTTLFRSIPTVEPAAERQLVHRSVETGLVVDLISRQMRHDVLDAPAATVAARRPLPRAEGAKVRDRKSTRLNSSHQTISYAAFCVKHTTA